MKAPLLLCALFLAAGARAGIVLDDAPQGSFPVPPANSIAVPKPEGASAAPGDKSPPVPDLLHFANKDLLHGSLLGIDHDGVHWQSPLAEKPMVFRTANLVGILLHPRGTAGDGARPLHDVLLANGDLLPGDVVSLDDKSLVLDTRYAGRLTILRSAVKSISAKGIVYQGPTGLEGWVSGPDAANPSWEYKDGTFSTAAGYGTIGRDVNLPSVSRISFDLATDGNTQLNIYLCSDHAEKPGNSYVFQIDYNRSAQNIEFARYSPDRANVRIGTQASSNSGMALSNKTHFEIRINKEKKMIQLYVDGKMSAEYNRLDDLPKMGGCLVFSPGFAQGQVANIQISKIRVRSWDGGTWQDNDAAGQTGDTIKLAGRDAIRCRLKGIAGGKVAFASPDGDQEVPVAQFEWMRLSSGAPANAKTGAHDVRAWFLTRGSVTMEIESWDAKQVTATSPAFGSAVFPPGVFRRLQFNPGNQPAPAGDGAVDTNAAGDDD